MLTIKEKQYLYTKTRVELVSLENRLMVFLSPGATNEINDLEMKIEDLKAEIELVKTIIEKLEA